MTVSHQFLITKGQNFVVTVSKLSTIFTSSDPSNFFKSTIRLLFEKPLDRVQRHFDRMSGTKCHSKKSKNGQNQNSIVFTTLSKTVTFVWQHMPPKTEITRVQGLGCCWCENTKKFEIINFLLYDRIMGRDFELREIIKVVQN